MRRYIIRFFAVFILAIIFFCYSPALKNGFTNWDDTVYIKGYPAVQHLSFQNIKIIFTSYFQGNYIPFTFCSFALEKALCGDSPKIFILNNIFFHLLNTLLVFFLVRMLLKNTIMALTAMLLFGLHPLHVESVAWIAERKDVLYALWFFLSLICYLYYLQASRVKWYFFSLLLMLFSVLSKTMGTILPAVLILTDWFLHRNILDRKVILEKIPFLLIAFLFIYIGMDAVHTNAEKLSSYQLSFVERIPLASYAFFSYIVKIILPFNLSAYYPYPLQQCTLVPLWLWSFAAAAAGLAVLLFYFRKKRFFVFSILFFVFNVFLVLQLFPVGDALMADRFTYVASLGMFLPAAHLFCNYYERRKQKIAAGLALGSYTLLLAYCTHERCKVWKDAATLWADVIAKHNNVPLAYINHGNAMYEKGNNSAAMNDYANAIRLDKNQKGAFYNRGVIYFSAKQFDSAAADFSEVLRISPDDGDALFSRALCSAFSGKKKEALEDLNRYIISNPGNADAFSKRGVMKMETGDSAGACADWKRAGALGSADAQKILEQYCR